MKKTTVILSILSVLLSILCFFFFYMWIDRSITLTYTELSYDEAVDSNEKLARIVLKEWKGKSASAVERKLKMIAEDINDNTTLIKWEDGLTALRQEKFDCILDSQGLIKSALPAKMAGAPVMGLDRKSTREGLASACGSPKEKKQSCTWTH